MVARHTPDGDTHHIVNTMSFPELEVSDFLTFLSTECSSHVSGKLPCCVWQSNADFNSTPFIRHPLLENFCASFLPPQLGSAKVCGLSKHFHVRGNASRTEEGGGGGTFCLASRSQRACAKKKKNIRKPLASRRSRKHGFGSKKDAEKPPTRCKNYQHMCFFSLLASSTQVLLRQLASVTVCKRSSELMVGAWSFRRPTNLCNLCSMGFLQHLCDWQETVSHFERPVWRFLRCCRAWLEVGAVGMCFCKVVFQDAACLCWNRTFLA